MSSVTADKILPRQFARHYIANGYNATEAYHAIRPSVTRGSAGELGHRLLKDVETMEAIAQETAKILGPDEVKQRISALADVATADRDKLKALELMARVHALLTDKVESHNYDETDLEAMKKQALEEAIQFLQGVESVSPVNPDTNKVQAGGTSEPASANVTP